MDVSRETRFRDGKYSYPIGVWIMGEQGNGELWVQMIVKVNARLK